MKEKLPIVGDPRGAGCCKTVELITSKLRRVGSFHPGGKLLDVGCGDGLFTRVLGEGFGEVYGIDVQDRYLEKFRASVADDPRFRVMKVSASEMDFPGGYFDTIITIETLEHVANLEGAVKEIARVLRPGGQLLITVPNRWFPFETHGISLGSWRKGGRIPLITYLPWLHRRIAMARVFTVGDLDRLFLPWGLRRTAVDYAWPTFEHGGNPLQKYLRPFFGLMRAMENSPLRFLGSSVIAGYSR